MKLLKIILALLGVVVLAFGALVGYLSATEYRPADVEALNVTPAARREPARIGQRIDVISFNIGYGGLGREQDFFMDGGEMVRPNSREDVVKNMNGIVSALASRNADVYLLQEVDQDSYRSYYIDESEQIRHALSLNMATALNYRCEFVPIPLPPMRKVVSGLATYTSLDVTSAKRISLPVPFQWPVRVANLKRCLLVERVPVADTERELVLINLHLEAYDDGEGKLAQTQQLMRLMEDEYRKGNYVIAGGDFNQTFEGAEDAFPMLSAELWQPGQLTAYELPTGFQYVYDDSTPTCRLLNKPYDGNRENTQFYMIDGFIVSDNLRVNHIETLDLNFAYSDHNPVLLQVTPR